MFVFCVMFLLWTHLAKCGKRSMATATTTASWHFSIEKAQWCEEMEFGGKQLGCLTYFAVLFVVVRTKWWQQYYVWRILCLYKFFFFSAYFRACSISSTGPFFIVCSGLCGVCALYVCVWLLHLSAIYYICIQYTYTVDSFADSTKVLLVPTRNAAHFTPLNTQNKYAVICADWRPFLLCHSFLYTSHCLPIISYIPRQLQPYIPCIHTKYW